MARRRSVGIIALAAALALLSSTAASPVRAAAPGDGSTERVVVSGAPGGGEKVLAAVARAGGTVVADLPVVEGVAAELPTGAADAVAAAPGVRTVSADAPVAFQVGSAPPSMRSAYPRTVRADRVRAGGSTGAGVTVAVVDSGIAPVVDLADRIVEVRDPDTGRPAPCADFSGERSCDDRYGHGTFMAGIIAGDGSASDGRWAGMAPGAELVSVKIAGRDGSSDVSKLLAAIQWVVSHRDTYGIDVLNLSLGTNSGQHWDVDPLNYAVQRAWAAGITVVVAASNMGPGPASVSKPGDDPWVLTVGATDDRGTPGIGDDRVPDFSSRGPTRHGVDKPDVAAPGANVVSLRSPGSTLDTLFGDAAAIDGAYWRGSGTSAAAAVATGAAALLLEDDPGRAPGDVKGALATTARPVAGAARASVGAGVLDVEAATAVAPGEATTSGPGRSSGLGLLNASRGDVRVRLDGPLLPTVLGSLTTAQLLLWDPIGYTTGNWEAGTWPRSLWLLGRWYRTSWHLDPWSGATMEGLNWHGLNWHGLNWHGLNWHGTWRGSTGEDGRRDDRYGFPALGSAWYGLWG